MLKPLGFEQLEQLDSAACLKLEQLKPWWPQGAGGLIIYERLVVLYHLYFA